MRRRTVYLLVVVLFAWSANSYAVTSLIGDVDGFGFGAATGLVGFDGNPAERTGNGLLDSSDVLPDLDGDADLDLVGVAVWIGHINRML